MPLPSANRIDTIIQSSWDSGMITTLPPEELPEDAAARIDNFEFDDIGNLKTRVPTVDFLTTTEPEGLSSLFLARYSNGTDIYYFTQGTKLFKVNTDGTGLTDITGAFVFPNANRWFWVMFDDFAIGVNGSTTQRPIKITSAGTVTTLNGSAPFGAYCEVWNSRLWISGVGSNRNTVFASAINDPEDWTVDDDAGAITLGVDINDGDLILAIKVFRGSLYVYKRNSIKVISAISAPATIPSNLRVDEYTSNVGCIAPATIQNILDDQVFLSHSGVMSLALAPLGEINSSLLSRNVAELSQLFITEDFPVSTTSPFGFVFAQKQQYIIGISGTLSLIDGVPTNNAWVMDYSDISKKDSEGLPKVRWCRFLDTCYGTVYENRPIAIGSAAFESYLIGQSPVFSQDTHIHTYSPNGGSPSLTGTVSKRLITRAFGIANKRTLWHRFSVGLMKLTTNVTFITNYYYDNFLTSVAGSYTHALTGTPANNNRNRWKSFKKNDSGRKANLVQIEITANTADQGFIIKSIGIEKTELNFRRATNSWNSD